MNTSKPSTGDIGSKIIAATFLLAVGYSVLRYNIAGDVPWEEIPLYVLNKGISLAAFTLLTFNFALGPAKNLGIPVSPSWLNARKAFGMTGFLLVLIHALISFMLFSASYYGKFYDLNGTLTGVASLCMLAGILGFVFLWAYNLSFQTKLSEDHEFIELITSRKVLISALALGGLHLVFMGYAEWLRPGDWHGGLPPVSLVAFVFFALGYALNLLGRE